MKFTTKTIHFVNYNDFDEAINDFLEEKGVKPYEYEVCVQHEVGDGDNLTFEVGLHDWAKISEDDKQCILDGELNTNEILEWMHEEGKIPAGEYLVEIFW
jgi:hypothetical protein